MDVLNEANTLVLKEKALKDFKEFQKKSIREGVRMILGAFPVDLENDDNFTGTPERVAKAYVEEWCSGYMVDPEDVITVFPRNPKDQDLVMVKDIPFFSTCAHHLAPFFGKAAVVYLPKDHVLGLSKFDRLLEVYTRRFQLQEFITSELADTLMRVLEPRGVMVILYDCHHMCMESRGVKAHGATTTTSAVRGMFSDDIGLRMEALSLLGLNK